MALQVSGLYLAGSQVWASGKPTLEMRSFPGASPAGFSSVASRQGPSDSRVAQGPLARSSDPADLPSDELIFSMESVSDQVLDQEGNTQDSSAPVSTSIVQQKSSPVQKSSAGLFSWMLGSSRSSDAGKPLTQSTPLPYASTQVGQQGKSSQVPSVVPAGLEPVSRTFSTGQGFEVSPRGEDNDLEEDWFEVSLKKGEDFQQISLKNPSEKSLGMSASGPDWSREGGDSKNGGDPQAQPAPDQTKTGPILGSFLGNLQEDYDLSLQQKGDLRSQKERSHSSDFDQVRDPGDFLGESVEFSDAGNFWETPPRKSEQMRTFKFPYEQVSQAQESYSKMTDQIKATDPGAQSGQGDHFQADPTKGTQMDPLLLPKKEQAHEKTSAPQGGIPSSLHLSLGGRLKGISFFQKLTAKGGQVLGIHPIQSGGADERTDKEEVPPFFELPQGISLPVSVVNRSPLTTTPGHVSAEPLSRSEPISIRPKMALGDPADQGGFYWGYASKATPGSGGILNQRLALSLQYNSTGVASCSEKSFAGQGESGYENSVEMPVPDVVRSQSLCGNPHGLPLGPSVSSPKKNASANCPPFEQQDPSFKENPLSVLPAPLTPRVPDSNEVPHDQGPGELFHMELEKAPSFDEKSGQADVFSSENMSVLQPPLGILVLTQREDPLGETEKALHSGVDSDQISAETSDPSLDPAEAVSDGQQPPFSVTLCVLRANEPVVSGDADAVDTPKGLDWEKVFQGLTQRRWGETLNSSKWSVFHEKLASNQLKVLCLYDILLTRDQLKEWIRGLISSKNLETLECCGMFITMKKTQDQWSLLWPNLGMLDNLKRLVVARNTLAGKESECKEFLNRIIHRNSYLNQFSQLKTFYFYDNNVPQEFFLKNGKKVTRDQVDHLIQRQGKS